MKKLSKTLAFLLSFAIILTSIVLPMSIMASAESADAEYQNFTGRKTWKFDTAPENENFQINMKSAAVDTANGYFYVPTNWSQTQPVNYQFNQGHRYIVNFKWKVSAKPTDGFQLQLRNGDTAFKNYGWMSTTPTEWQTDRIDFTATNTGLLKIYMNAGTGQTFYVDTISIYEVGSSVRFDFSDDTQLKAKYNSTRVQLSADETVSASVVNQWTTDVQFIPDYILEKGKKYVVTYRYKADVAKTSNTFAVNYNTGAGAWNSYDTANGFQTPSIKTTAANTWYTGSFEFVAANDDTHPYLGIALRPTLPGNYEFDDITISQSCGNIVLDTMDGNTENAITSGAKVGSNFTLPTPRRTGYSFVSWYTEPELINAVTSITVPAENQSVTVYAKWEVATSYFLDFSDSRDIEASDSWFNGSGCKPQISNGELYFRGSPSTNPSYARLPIVLEAATYKYSFKYKANPATEGNTFSLYMNAGLNAAKTTTEFNNAYTTSTAKRLFNTVALSTGNEYVTVSGTFTVTDNMISDTANRLTLRYATKAEGDLLYIDDFSFEKVITRTYDFSDASQVGNAYSAVIEDETLVLSANAGQQSRARLDCELTAGRSYILSYKYKANKPFDVKLAPWYAQSVATYNNWYFCGGDNEAQKIIPGMDSEYFFADTEWKTEIVRFTANGNIDGNYKYLAFRMQSSLAEGKIYIDDVVLTECARTLQFNTNGGEQIENLTYQPVATSINLPVAVKENNIFDGWFFDEQLQNSVGNTYSPSVGTPITFYAKWIAKTANGSTPNAPEVSFENGIAYVSETSGNEYKLGDGNWQTSNEFGGLVAGPTYSFYQRVAETATVASSSVSDAEEFTIYANGDYDEDSDFDADDLTGIVNNILGKEASNISLVDVNEDGNLNIIDLVKIEKIIASGATLFVGNNDITAYALVENFDSSFIADKASEVLSASILEFTGKELAEDSSKTITLSISEDDEDGYTISVDNGNIEIVATSDYMLLNAVNAFVSRFKDSTVFVHFPKQFALSNEIVDTDSGYSLAWSDEFSGTELNRDNWVNDIYSNTSGDNTVFRTCNAVEVNNGTLKLNTYAGETGKWYGADIRTTGKYDFSYGYVEIRAKLPGSGNCGSFWLIGSDEERRNEVDIFETFGDTKILTTTVHKWTGSSGEGHAREKFENAIDSTYSTDYHTYGCEWTAEYLKFYIDGVLKNTFTFSDNPQLFTALADGDSLPILLGNSTGYDNTKTDFTHIKGNPTPGTFEIDYVRVYQ